MKKRLILAYILNLLDMAIMICCYGNVIDVCLYHLPRPWLNDVIAFICAKVILIGMSLWCTHIAWTNGRCTEMQSKIKSWIWVCLYIFLLIYDITILIIGGAA